MTNAPQLTTLNGEQFQHMHRLVELPFRSVLDLAHDPTQPGLDVWLWQSPENLCELDGSDQGRCDTTAGLYYGTGDEREPKFCPRHFYATHYGPDASYQLADLPTDLAA